MRKKTRRRKTGAFRKIAALRNREAVLSRRNVMRKIFAADDKELHNVIAFIEEELEAHEVSMKNIMAITVAVEEIFVNIAHYAYEGKEPGEAVVSIDFPDDIVEITFEDNGMEFDPLAKTDPDIELSAEERSIGGLGIYMVKKSMDECLYEHNGETDIFRMRKKIR